MKLARGRMMAIVKMAIDSVRQELLNYGWVVMLRQKFSERELPVYVGATG